MRGAAARLGRPFSRQQRRPSVDYILVPVIGAGSHGYVQTATCKETGAEVAIKTIHGNRKVHGSPSTWPSAAAKEAFMLDSVRDHPGVGKLHGSYAQTDELNHLVTELCRGATLQDVIEDSGPLSEPQALGIMRELLSVVDGVHSAGVAHLDVKPGNIILEVAEGGVQLKLIDFGSSELLDDAGVALPGVPGTGGYVAPEGCTKQFHANSDAYSCGVTLHKMLSGYRNGTAHSPRKSRDRIQELCTEWTLCQLWKASQMVLQVYWNNY